MYSMSTRVNDTVTAYLKVAKRLNLKSSHYKKKIFMYGMYVDLLW